MTHGFVRVAIVAGTLLPAGPVLAELRVWTTTRTEHVLRSALPGNDLDLHGPLPRTAYALVARRLSALVLLCARESLLRSADDLEKKLAGPSPSPLEQLSARRVAACWLQLQFTNTLHPQPDGQTLRQQKFVLKLKESAEHLFDNAVRSLALVRKLVPGVAIAKPETVQAPAPNGQAPEAHAKNGKLNGKPKAQTGKLNGKPKAQTGNLNGKTKPEVDQSAWPVEASMPINRIKLFMPDTKPDLVPAGEG